MKFPFLKNTFLNTYYLLFSFFLIYLLIQKIRLGFLKESYQITEFLINYQGGFVRRGLLGEIILILYNTFGFDPYTIIIAISLASFVVLVWFFVHSLIKKGYPLFFLPFVFFLGNPVIHDFFIRKDILLILLFILTVICINRRTTLNIIFANIFLITGILIHESIAFFSFPILFLILFSNQNNLPEKRSSSGRSFFQPVLLLSPSLVAFLLVLYYKGSLTISQKIWDSWSSIPFPYVTAENQEIPAAIDGLSWSLKEGLLYSYHTLRNFNDGIYAPLGWFLIILTIYYILTNTDKLNFRLFGYRSSNNFNSKAISNLLLLQFYSVIPLFILGWDYSRWIFYWVTSSFAAYLLIPQKELFQLWPGIFSEVTGKINNTLNLIFNGSNVLLLSVLIGFSASSWSLLSTINSSSIVIVLRFISKVLEEILVLLKGILF